MERKVKVQFRANLSRHSSSVNVVRFSPNGKHSSESCDLCFKSCDLTLYVVAGELLASAGDGELLDSSSGRIYWL